MIVSPELIVIGRRERLGPHDGLVREFAERALGEAASLWRSFWTDKLSDWELWNVLVLHGEWGRWTDLTLLRAEGLGFDPAPGIVSTWTLRVGSGSLKQVDLGCEPVLRDSLDLLCDEDWPEAPKGVRAPKTPGELLGLKERLLEARRLLDATGCWSDPRSGTRPGLERVLAERDFELAIGYDVQTVKPLAPEAKRAAHPVEVMRAKLRATAAPLAAARKLEPLESVG